MNDGFTNFGNLQYEDYEEPMFLASSDGGGNAGGSDTTGQVDDD